MKWKIMLIIFLIITFSIGYTLLKYNYPCSNQEDQIDKDHCYFSMALIKDVVYCEKIIDQEMKDKCNLRITGDCHYSITKENQNIALCDKIIRDEYRYMCYDTFDFEGLNPDSCEEITIQIYKDRCYDVLATEKKDPNLCKKIVSQDYKDYCYFGLAKVQQNISLCTNIVYNITKQKCIDVFSVKKDRGNWTPISNECYCMENDFKGQEPDICDNFTLYKDVCYRLIALEKQNPEICKEISSPDQLLWCYEGIALATQNPDICKTIPYIYTKDDCYAAVAGATQNTDLCEKIVNRHTKSLCHYCIIT